MKLLKTNNKLVETKLKYFETNIKLRSHRLSGGPNIPGDLGRQGGGEACAEAQVEVGEEEEAGEGGARQGGEDGNGEECERQERGKDVSHLGIS